METAIIIAIISSAISMLLAIFNIVTNIKQHNKKVISEYQLDLLKTIRQASTVFLTITKVEIIDFYKENPQKKDYIAELCTAAVRLKQLITAPVDLGGLIDSLKHNLEIPNTKYDFHQYICQEMDKLVSLCINRFKGTNEISIEEITKTYNECYLLLISQEQDYWLIIKKRHNKRLARKPEKSK